MQEQWILYEDNHLIAVNKRCGELVQGDSTGDRSLDRVLKNYLKEKYNKPGNVFVGVIHRLDRPVSGVVVFAKTSKALSRMNSLFRTKEVVKKYWAIVKNPPPGKTGLLVHYMEKNEKQNKSYVYEEELPRRKRASMEYTLRSCSDRYYLLEIELHTGRHHQIRAQLAHLGSPVKGDLKYGFPRSNPDAGISLHARSIEFIHPVRREKTVLTAEPPENDIWKHFV
jgi:23S rRNA pseudouridine1911/1915/1917 synthase